MPLYSIETHGELHPFIGYEWLVTNGIGGFALSTLVGCNTRRYHGLLCAATQPPVGRIMALSRIGELVYLDGQEQFLELSINRFGNALHPRGERYLQRFELGDTARWEYHVEGVRIVKELLLCWQKNTVAVRYTVEPQGQRPVELHLLPFVSMRDYHALRHKDGAHFDVSADTWEMRVREGANTLHLRTDAGEFQRREDWWLGHTYSVETERGLDDTEDLFVPGLVRHKMTGRGVLTLWATVDSQAPIEFDWEAEVASRPAAAARVYSVAPSAGVAAPASSDAPPLSPTLQRLIHAANDFVVQRRRPDGEAATTILAGYPWFADWGRDTMISLPGLLLSTGRFNEARDVLVLFAEYVSEGMIPNRFDDYTNEPSYNTVDASLWFIHAAFEYVRLSGDAATFNDKLMAACRAVYSGYREGTRFKIQMDPADGLITAGDENTQLTWMDAKCDGVVFTPRHGKAVEINALWYNALKLLRQEELAERVRQSFVKVFWRNAFRGLYDVVHNGQRDGAIRPNQIFAVSLPHSPLDDDQQHGVVEVVRRELLTPYGLKTLARSEPGYQGRYGGGPMQRDRAYHNGTVWPWLIGPFLGAYLRVNGRSSDAMRQARVWLQPLIDHMNQGCVGQISECFEGDDPHRPVACPAQAWSVAEVLRIAVEVGM